MANFDPLSFSTLLDGTGAVAASAKLNYYETGSTTPKAVYSDAGLTAAISQPVRASTLGVVPIVYLSAGRYKRAVTTSADVTISAYAADPIDASVEMIAASAAPSPSYAFQEYWNTTDGHRYRRDSTNSSWIDLGLVDGLGSAATVAQDLAGTATNVFTTPASNASHWARGTDIASAGTLSLPSTGGGWFNITGTTTCTGISSAQGGRTVKLKFAGACQLTHNASSFILLDGVNELTAANYVYEFTNDAAASASGSNWRCTGRWIPNSNAMLSKSATFTVDDSYRDAVVRISGLAADATVNLPAAANRSGFRLTLVNENVFADNVANTSPFGFIVDPNGAELIDGLTTRKSYAWSRITIECDGTGWRTVAGKWRYFSGNQAISANGSLTLAHNLGVSPKQVWCRLQNTTAELGFTQFDITDYPLQSCDGTTPFGSVVIPDTTNLNVRQSNSAAWFIINKTTNANANITAASWRAQYYAED